MPSPDRKQLVRLLRRIDERLNVLDLKARGACLKAGLPEDCIRNIRRGHKPSGETLKALAPILKTTTDYLLDTLEGEASPQDAGTPVPVIDRVQAGDWSEVHDPYALGGGEEYLLTDLSVSDHTFALVIKGTSMAPEFQPGDKVVIDPALVPRPGDLVVAKRDKDQEATFKKYRLRAQDERGRDVTELVPLNLDWPTLLIDADNPGHIIGIMVEHRRYRRPE